MKYQNFALAVAVSAITLVGAGSSSAQSGCSGCGGCGQKAPAPVVRRSFLLKILALMVCSQLIRLCSGNRSVKPRLK